jgi:hypothetical protein
MFKWPANNEPPKTPNPKAIVDGPWAAKEVVYGTAALGAGAYYIGAKGPATYLLLSALVLYMQREQMLPWQ